MNCLLQRRDEKALKNDRRLEHARMRSNRYRGLSLILRRVFSSHGDDVMDVATALSIAKAHGRTAAPFVPPQSDEFDVIVARMTYRY